MQKTVHRYTLKSTNAPLEAFIFPGSIFLVIFMLFSFQAYSQDMLSKRISLSMQEVSPKKALEEIQKKSGLRILFGESINQYNSVKISISNTAITVKEALETTLRNTGLTYEQMGNHILVKEKPAGKTSQQQPVRQQPGSISGKVLDERGEPLPAASVKVIETGKGLQGSVDGTYQFSLPADNYTLEVSFMGYQTRRITDVRVQPGKSTPLDIVMQVAANSLSGVVVTAGYKKASVEGLYARQKNSTAITDGISADLVRRTPDRNAGDAIKRVTGISVLDGKYVVVRGLPDRYNYTMMNGGIMPSTEPDRRTFSLDLIPAQALESIVVTKTATADLPGEFAGGVVQVSTRDFPEQDFVTISAGTGFYEGQTGKAFFKDVDGKKDWMGKDDGSRALPKELDLSSTQMGKLSPEYRFKISNALSKGWEPVQSGKAQPIQSFQFGLGKTFSFPGEHKLGVLALANYRRDQTIDRARRYDLAYFVASGGPGDTLGFLRSYPDERSYRDLVNVGALLNIAYQFKRSKISLKNIYNRDFETISTLKYGEKTLGNGIEDIVDAKGVDMHPTIKTLLGTQLQGDHRIGDKNPVTLTWNIAYNKIEKYEPNQTRLGYVNLYRDDTIRYKDRNYFVPEFGSLESGTKLYTRLNENAYNVNFAVTTPFSVAGQQQQIKAGTYAQFRKRTYHTRNLGYFDAARGVTDQFGGFYPGINFGDSVSIDKILIPENFRPGGLAVVTYELPANEYTGGANLASAFVNVESNIGKKLKLVYGARVEFYSMSLSTNKELVQVLPGSGGGDSHPPVDYIRYDEDVLPSASIIYKPHPSVNVRAAWSKTLTRPEFREVSPYEYFDFVSGYTTMGNPELKKGAIQNLDFRVEWFPSAGEIISASVFRKDLRDPIELKAQATTSTGKYVRFYRNVEEAEIRGIEFELRKNLYFGAGPEWLRNIILFGNYARIKSRIKGKAEGYTDGRNLTERPLMGQSPYLLNAGILVNAIKNTFSFSAALNRAGRRIVVVGTTAEDSGPISSYPDIYENPRNQLDLQIGQKLFKQSLELRINASNLLNDDFIQYQDYDLNGKYSGNTFDATVYSRKSYRHFSFTLSYTFK